MHVTEVIPNHACQCHAHLAPPTSVDALKGFVHFGIALAIPDIGPISSSGLS